MSSRCRVSMMLGGAAIGLRGMGLKLWWIERYVKPPFTCMHASAVLLLTRHCKKLLSPICGAREHDSISLYIAKSPSSSLEDDHNLPDPPATEVVNSALQLFAICLPLQTPKIQESILEQMTSFLSASSLQRDTHRKAAMVANIAYALLSALKVAVRETRCVPGDLKSAAVEKVMLQLLMMFITLPDPYVRALSAAALGRLCASSGSGTPFTTTTINMLIDAIVANREPHARSGYAAALGAIHSQLGGMAAGYHLKNIHGILMSLANDPHPVVHFWALDALARVADSAGLSFAAFVPGTLGMLAQLYGSDTHNDEGANVVSSNLEVELPTPAVLARCIDSAINVLGPDLQDNAKTRGMIMTLINLFKHEGDELVTLEGLMCQEHMSLYAPGYIDFTAYVRYLQSLLSSAKGSKKLRDMAIGGLHNLMRRDTEEVLRAADPGLEEQLWLVLDAEPGHEIVRAIVRNWLSQTALSDTGAWVQRLQTVLTKTKRTSAADAIASAQNNQESSTAIQDEEVAGFAATTATNSAPGGGAGATEGQELLKWQVRAFAMALLAELIQMVGREKSIREEAKCVGELQGRVADVVRSAFGASTAGVVELRLGGLRVLEGVLRVRLSFSPVPFCLPYSSLPSRLEHPEPFLEYTDRAS